MDNQIIQTRKGLMGFFESFMIPYNKMLRNANLTVPVEYEEDWTIIPVNVFKNGKKSHEVETGVMTFCEHIETPNNTCLKCGEWQDC